ncbi:YcxB family protein [Lacrimispora defluvii]|uniref:YcxB family protein n=1 Tax=Lacrimispora defluvii TaxID=2719233 RepID=A0ABX1VR13_9FIRM|nr:YcxB family protein [Lacrimispora defluvii]NNJ30534.1 YcxB family protein [Lacrimispora defluvii]
MKNRCIHTQKVMKEYHYAVMRDYYRKLIIPFLIVYLLIIINFVMKFMKHDIGTLTIFYVAAPVFLAGVLIAKLEKVIRLNQRRMQVIYGKSDCECMVEFKDLIMITTENKNQREISYQDILKYIETKNLIILIFDGRIFIPLDKNGFIEGDVESFREFIDGKIKK